MGISKILAFSVGPLGSALLSFATLPIVTWFFSQEDVGRIAMLQVLTGFMVLVFSLGLDQAYVREYHESEQKEALFRETFLPGLSLLLISLAVVTLLPVSIAALLFDIDSNLLSAIVIVCLIFSFIARFLSLILRMQDRGLAFSMSQLLPKILFLLVVASYCLVIAEFTFLHLIVAHLVSITAVVLVFLWNARDTLWRATGETINYVKLKQMLLFGAPLILGGVAFWGLTSMDKVFLRSVANFHELALYSVAVSFATGAIIFQSVFSLVWAPTVYKWAVEGLNEDKIDKVTEYVLLIVILIFCLAGAFAWLVTYLLPADYADVQYILVCCMSYPLFYTLSEATVIGLGIKKKSGYSMLASLLAFVLNCIGNSFLVPVLGAKGAAISTAVSFWFFLVLRTEFASKVWRPLPRIWLYISTFYCLANGILYCLFGKSFNVLFIWIWSLSGIFSLFIYRKDIVRFYLYLMNKRQLYLADR